MVSDAGRWTGGEPPGAISSCAPSHLRRTSVRPGRRCLTPVSIHRRRLTPNRPDGPPCRAPVDGLSRRAEGDYGIVFGLFESIRLGTELPKGGVMLDHVTANVGDFDQAKRFY